MRADGAAGAPGDLLDAIERARPRLARIGTSFHCLASVGSTNDYASAVGIEGAVVVADRQTAGRGRRGHSWFSPPGSGLYVSLVLAPGRARVEPLRATTLLTIAVGVALAEGLESATGLRADLKWPNDLYVGRRKLAGILAEAAFESGRRAAPDPASASTREGAPAPRGLVTVGYGINAGPMAYPPDLAERATALDAELGRPVDRAHVLAGTLAAVDSRYGDLLEGRFDAILDAWRLRAPGAAGARVAWIAASGPRSGVTAGLDADGALLVRSGGRVERIVGGELTWI